MFINVLSKVILGVTSISLSYAAGDPYSYDKALNLSDKTILSVSSFLREVQESTVSIEELSVVTRKNLYIKKDEKPIIIALKDGNDYRIAGRSLTDLNVSGVFLGRIPKRTEEIIHTIFREIEEIFPLSDKLFQHDFIFTGRGAAGEIALILALKFKLSLIGYIKSQQSNFQKFNIGQNRIKAILFNASQVCDDTFTESIHKYLGIENVLHFHYSLTRTLFPLVKSKNVGLRFDILPFEELLNIKSKSLKRAIFPIASGVIGAVYLQYSVAGIMGEEYLPDSINPASLFDKALRQALKLKLRAIPILIGAVPLLQQCIRDSDVPSNEVIKAVMSYVRSRKIEIGELWPVEEVGHATLFTNNRGAFLLGQRVLGQRQLRASL